eukprot:2040256-Rhodomonas_salina.5
MPRRFVVLKSALSCQVSPKEESFLRLVEPILKSHASSLSLSSPIFPLLAPAPDLTRLPSPQLPGAAAHALDQGPRAVPGPLPSCLSPLLMPCLLRFIA